MGVVESVNVPVVAPVIPLDSVRVTSPPVETVNIPVVGPTEPLVEKRVRDVGPAVRRDRVTVADQVRVVPIVSRGVVGVKPRPAIVVADKPARLMELDKVTGA